MTTIQGIGLAAGLAALTMTATTASADQLRFAIGHPPASFLVKAGETMAKTMAAEHLFPGRVSAHQPAARSLDDAEHPAGRSDRRGGAGLFGGHGRVHPDEMP
jgi:hypothetical protein